MAFLPYVFTVLSFFGGFYISSLSFANKLDNLTGQISTLANSFDRMTDKVENSKERYNNLDKRVSILEIKNELKPAAINIDNDQTKK